MGQSSSCSSCSSGSSCSGSDTTQQYKQTSTMGQSSSCSSCSSGSSGSEWTNEVHLYPDATNRSFRYVLTGDAHEYEKFIEPFIDMSETITSVSDYESKSHDSATCLNHKIFVFETKSCIYSAEKTNKNIIVQRQEIKQSEREKALLTLVGHCRGRKRNSTPVELKKEKENPKETIVRDFIFDFLKGEINKKYDLCSSNCKDFVKSCFVWINVKKGSDQSQYELVEIESKD